MKYLSVIFITQMREKQENWRKVSSQVDYYKFLKKFKTQLCPTIEFHPEDSCFYYHLYYQQSSLSESMDYHSLHKEPLIHSLDQRHSPYSKMNEILYQPKMCEKKNGDCKNNQCSLCHNLWEYNFHPYIFKSINCQNFYQCQTVYCSKLHYSDYKINPKNNIPVLSFSEFFRFDLNIFKTQQCNKQYSHDKNLCLFYHNSKDFRRDNFSDYDHILCQKAKCQDRNCPFSHNKIQQLYHPSRYKSKYCEKYYISMKKAKKQNNSENFKSLCPYGQFCSFAHDNEELSIQLIDKLPRTLEFHLYSYKTVWCPITTDHNRSQCVYAHNIQDYRRNPKQYYYEPEQCPEWKKNESIKGLQDAGCPRGMSCQKCHGWKEKQYHPVIYSKSKPVQYKLKQKQRSQSFTSSEGNKQITIESQPRGQKTNNIDLVNKKLGTVNGQNNNKLELIINKQLQGNKKQHYQPGTPFFKNSRSVKPKSKSEKGQLTTNIENEQKLSHVVEKGSVYTLQSLQITSGNNKLYEMEDDFENQIFKVFQLKNIDCVVNNSIHKCKGSSQYGQQQSQQEQRSHKNQQRSKSLGIRKKFSTNCFSHEFTQVLDKKIINILKEKKINEIKLINMAEQEIKKIDELSKSQKNLLILTINKSKPFNDRTPNYTRTLQKFFLSHKRKSILQKMKTKRVKQQKLLLLDSQIKELSFLTQSQKNELPSIIKQFTNHQQFDSIKEDIEQSIKSQEQNP